MPGHNLAFTALGVFILWLGWYGSNCGSQLTYAGAANADATVRIAVTTTLAAAAGTVVAMILSWLLFKKTDLSMTLNGTLGGLVGVTASCNQVSYDAAMLIGAIAGALVVVGALLLDRLRVDDPVGVFPAHGMCGVWGGLATGIFGSAIPEGLTRGGYLWGQTYSTALVCGWSFSAMLALFLILKAFGMLRVGPEDEQAGLDISEHGMRAYPPHLAIDHYEASPPAATGEPGWNVAMEKA